MIHFLTIYHYLSRKWLICQHCSGDFVAEGKVSARSLLFWAVVFDRKLLANRLFVCVWDAHGEECCNGCGEISRREPRCQVLVPPAPCHNPCRNAVMQSQSCCHHHRHSLSSSSLIEIPRPAYNFQLHLQDRNLALG